jgi:hypothetical protein
MLSRLMLLATPLFAVTVARAQTMTMPMSGPDHAAVSTAPITPHVREEIATARRVAADLDTPEKARAAGYRPRFGDVPLQGEHWTNPQLVLSGKFDLEHPPILMFASVAGYPRLLGVAYAYEVTPDAPVPDGFDGAAMWHEHPALSLPGKRLVMTHVWFIDSPNGPFAHDNPTIAFLERGMTWPPAGWLNAAQQRKLSLAMSLANHPAPGGSRFANTGPRSDSMMTVLMAERDRVNTMVPGLEQALSAKQRDAYRTLAERIGNESDAMIATIKDPISRMVFGRLLDEALGGS